MNYFDFLHSLRPAIWQPNKKNANSSNVVEGYQNQIFIHITAGVKILSKGMWSYTSRQARAL